MNASAWLVLLGAGYKYSYLLTYLLTYLGTALRFSAQRLPIIIIIIYESCSAKSTNENDGALQSIYILCSEKNTKFIIA